MPHVDHDAGDPPAGADARQDDVARHFEQRVAEEEDAGAPAVDVGADAQILVHRQRGEGDVGAVDVRDQVAHDDQRQQPPRDLRDDRPLRSGDSVGSDPASSCSGTLRRPTAIVHFHGILPRFRCRTPETLASERMAALPIHGKETTMKFVNDPAGTRLPIKLDTTTNGEFAPVPLDAVHHEANHRGPRGRGRQREAPRARVAADSWFLRAALQRRCSR